MDLGKASVRRNGINTLHSAVHRKHGLSWTDGRCIYLAPVKIISGVLQNEDSIKLGEFDKIRSLHWSADLEGDYCFLCVVHSETVSIWRVGGLTPQLKFKQVRKINASPILQGCLWNPDRDILCILNSTQCSFYFNHLNNKGSFALPVVQSGKITCGTWSDDGQTLVIGVGTDLMIYKWTDIDKSISDNAMVLWKIPGVDGQISTMVPISGGGLLCTVELPLETLCRQQQDIFQIPDISSSEVDSGYGENTDSHDIIKSQQHQTTNIFQLQSPPQSVTDSSQMVLVALEGTNKPGTHDPVKLSSVTLKGIITPNLLLYDVEKKAIFVGSNMQSSIQMFSLAYNNFNKVTEIPLEKDERVKGLCSIPKSRAVSSKIGTLVMTGKMMNRDHTFLPSSVESECNLHLKYVSISQDLYNDSLDPPVYRQTTSPPKSDTSLHDLKLPNGGTVTNGATQSKIETLDSDEYTNGKHELNNSVRATSKVGQRINEKYNQKFNDTDTSLDIDTSLKHDTSLDLGASIASSLSSSESYSSPRGDSSQNLKITDLDGGSESSQSLEVEKTDFSEQSAYFKTKLASNNVKKSNSIKRIHKSDSFTRSGGRYGNRPYSPRDRRSPYMDWRYTPEGSFAGSTQSLGTSSELSQGKYGMVDRCSLASEPGIGTVGEGAGEGQEEPTVEQLEKQIHIQNLHLTQLHARIDEITSLLEDTTCVPVTRYLPATQPDVVKLMLKQGSEVTQVKSFVLDNGRLQLDLVKQAFNLETVELVLDGLTCMVGSNVDGYIPVKFTPNSTMFVTGVLDPHRLEKNSSSC
ncbi:unnamed protein product [Owenia fusiformis]|nr:unnamed protein product [Owenia fusiformis]